MRRFFVVLLIVAAFLANINAASTTMNSKITFSGATSRDSTTRLLRADNKTNNEERAVITPTVPGLVKRVGQIIVDNVRVRYWLLRNKKTHEDIFKKLKLDGGMEQALTNKKLNTWITYVSVYNKKNPDKKISVIGMFTKTYGDDVLARALESAKGLQKTKVIANQLSRMQKDAWATEGKTIKDVLKVLKLDTAGDDLFTRQELTTWISYIERTIDKKLPPEVIGMKTRATAVSILEAHYGSAAFAKMLATANPPIKSLRLLATRLENTMVQRWLGGGKSIDDVFVLLKLNESAEKLLANPALKTWMGFARLYNEKHPDAKVPMLKTLANFFDAKVMSKVLVDGRKDPRTSALVKELQAGL